MDIEAGNITASTTTTNTLSDEIHHPPNPVIVSSSNQNHANGKAEGPRSGYPAYSNLLGQHAEYQNFRRFRSLRMRMLLLKQDAICKLEEELNQIDQSEKAELFSGSCRMDKNEERKMVLKKLDEAFRDYAGPGLRNLSSQNSWLDRGSIARKETMYLHNSDRELLNIGIVRDRAMMSVANAVEVALESFHRFVSLLHCSAKTDHGTIEISNAFVRGLARAVAASLAVILLLVPVIVLNTVTRTVVKFGVLFVSATLFVSVVTITSQATLGDIFAAGAAYTAVLVVFVSGNGVSGTPTAVASTNG